MIPVLFMTIVDEEQYSFMVKLYDEYYPLMKMIAVEHVYNNNDVDDAVQSAFVSLMKKVALLQTFERYILDVYIVRTIENKCVDFNRRRQRDKTHMSKEDIDDVTEYIGDISDTEGQVMLKLEYEKLGMLLARIPDKLRDVILMKYIYGYDDRKIAKEIGINKHSVRVYLSRGREAIATLARKEEKNGI